MVQKRVLVVDDDAHIATMLSRSLERHGFAIECFASADEALARAERTAFDAALLDLVMPEQDGLTLAGALRAKQPELRIALLTGYTHSPLLRAAERQGLAVFVKPVVVQEIADFLEKKGD